MATFRRTATITIAGLSLVGTGVVAGLAAGTGTVEPPPRIAFLANGINPADALAAGPIAGRLGAPLFTTTPDGLSDAAATGLADYEPELVIALGGPVALDDDVLLAAGEATGLAVLPASSDAPAEGITRVFGETRYDTAAAVADLINAYAPGFLPVDATALDALEADDADTLDGRDSSAFLTTDAFTWTSREFTGYYGQFDNPTTADVDEGRASTFVGEYANFTRAGTGEDFGFVFQHLPVTQYVADGSPNLQIDAVEACWIDTNELDELVRIQVTAYDVRDAFSGSADHRVAIDEEGEACQTLTLDPPLVVDANREVVLTQPLRPNGDVGFKATTWFLSFTDDEVTPNDPDERRAAQDDSVGTTGD